MCLGNITPGVWNQVCGNKYSGYVSLFGGQKHDRYGSMSKLGRRKLWRGKLRQSKLRRSKWWQGNLWKSEWVMIIAVGVVAATLFFGRLFVPEPAIFFPVDAMRSDVWNFGYPMKVLLNQSLRQGQLPFWSDQVGMGFPVLAESQVGALFLPNLILFGLLPTTLAWNLSYVLVLLVNFLGMVGLMRHLKTRVEVSVITGLIYALSGFFMTHLVHLNMLEAAMFLPWIIWLGLKLVDKPCWKNELALAATISLQIYAGYAQISFISLVGLGMVVLVESIRQKRGINTLGRLVSAVVLGLLLSGPQLLPTWEFHHQSDYAEGNAQVFDQVYPVEHLLSFLNPNYFGTPKDGSYPAESGDWGLYWESTFYVGILPLVVIAAGLKTRRRRSEVVWWGLVVFGVVMALGKYSPFKFLYSFPGFGSFRVPARVMLLVVLGGMVLFGQTLEKLRQEMVVKGGIKKAGLGLMVIGVLVVADVWRYGYDLYPVVPVRKLIAEPDSMKFIDTKERVFTHPAQRQIWGSFYERYGWDDPAPFVYMRNALTADSNVVWGVPSSDFYAGLYTFRQAEYFGVLSRTVYDLNNIGYVITPGEWKDMPGMRLVGKVEAPQEGWPDYFVYQNLSKVPRFRLVPRVLVEPDRLTIMQAIAHDSLDVSREVWVESGIELDDGDLTDQEVREIKVVGGEQILSTKTDKDAVLVTADTYYPGWEATIDGRQAEIIPVNVIHRGVVVPAGEHVIRMVYVPRVFYWGLLLAVMGGGGWFWLRKGEMGRKAELGRLG